MMAILPVIAALAAAPAQPDDAAHIRCAFEKAGELATSTAEPAETVAKRVLSACSAALGPVDEATRMRIRAAAVAVVNRRRGVDGQAQDAPFRLPNLADVPTGRFDVPDEIAPAIVPYMMCQAASAGVPVYTEGRKQLIAPPAGIGKGSGCSAARELAARRADLLLRRRGGMTKKARAQLIERTLAGADAFQRASELPPPPPPPPPSSEPHAEH
jgi:hypothetical protein